VAWLANDGKEVAHGIVALERPKALNGVNLTPTRVAVTISKVIISSFLLSPSLCPSKRSVSLDSFGQPPFTIVSNSRNLCVCILGHDMVQPPVTPQSEDNMAMPAAGVANVADVSPSIPHNNDPMAPSLEQVLDEDQDLADADDLEQNFTDRLDSDLPEQPLMGSSRDPDAEIALSRVMEPYENMSLVPDNVTRTRVIFDNWHCHNLFPVSRQHGVRRPFVRALSMAFFLPMSEDRLAVEQVLKKLGTSYDAQLLSRPRWIHARVRRVIPPPEVLLPRVAEVIKTYGAVRDATTSQPLFNARAWDAAKSMLENVRLGYYSDPPGVELYFKMGVDKNGLTTYRCCRGTNSVEGGVHQNIIRKYDSFNTSPRHGINVILEYAVRHNIAVGC
jgi:hypothetical protein